MVTCSSFASQASMTSAMVCMIADDENDRHHNDSDIVNNGSIYSSVTSSLGYPRQYEKEKDVWKMSWDSETQGWVVSSFFVGYYVMQIPSGVINTRFGPKGTLVVGLLCAGILHLLSIPAARWNLPLLYLVRTLAGLSCGSMLSGAYALMANWCPAHEASFLFGISGVGLEVGNSLAFILALFGCESGIQGGWPIVFYGLGGLQMVLAVIMMVFLTDFPSSNKHIDPWEARYIDNNRAHYDNAKSIPVRRILLSLPVWAFLVAELSIEWMYYTLVTQGPLYLRDVIKLPHWKTNLMASVPFLAIIPLSVISGYVFDKVIQRNIVSKTTVRKINHTYASILTAVPILFLGFLSEGDWTLAFLAYMIAAIGITGTYAGYMVNPDDLSPAHTGFLVSLGQALSMWVGFVIPAFTGYITKRKDQGSWQTVFFIVVGLEAFGCIFYLLFGSGNLQPWALEEIEEITEETPIIRTRRGSTYKSF